MPKPNYTTTPENFRPEPLNKAGNLATEASLWTMDKRDQPGILELQERVNILTLEVLKMYDQIDNAETDKQGRIYLLMEEIQEKLKIHKRTELKENIELLLKTLNNFQPKVTLSANGAFLDETIIITRSRNTTLKKLLQIIQNTLAGAGIKGVDLETLPAENTATGVQIYKKLISDINELKENHTSPEEKQLIDTFRTELSMVLYFLKVTLSFEKSQNLIEKRGVNSNNIKWDKIEEKHQKALTELSKYMPDFETRLKDAELKTELKIESPYNPQENPQPEKTLIEWLENNSGKVGAKLIIRHNLVSEEDRKRLSIDGGGSDYRDYIYISLEVKQKGQIEAFFSEKKGVRTFYGDGKFDAGYHIDTILEGFNDAKKKGPKTQDRELINSWKYGHIDGEYRQSQAKIENLDVEEAKKIIRRFLNEINKSK